MALEPSCERAVRVLDRHQRMRADILGSALGIGIVMAALLLDRMASDGFVGREDKEGWRHVLRRTSEENAAPRARGTQEHAESDAERRVKLEATITRPKESGRVIIAQRDEWKQRALAAEAKLRDAHDIAKREPRIGEMKRLIARELHRDAAAQDSLERVAREHLFKRIWPILEGESSI